MQILFIHIPKNAGKSIRKYLVDQVEYPYAKHSKKHSIHFTSLQYEKYLSSTYQDHYKFAVVRNPWQRVCSLYFFARTLGTSPRIQGRLEFLKIVKKNNFNDWVKIIYGKQVFRKSKCEWIKMFVTQNQIDWLVDQNGEINMNRVCHFETLKDDLLEMFKEMNIKELVDNIDTFEKINQTKHPKYRTIYNEESKKLIADFYSRDIEAFNFSF